MNSTCSRALLIALSLGLGLGVHGSGSRSAPPAPLHLAPNHNFDVTGQFTPARAGFNLADLDNPDRLKALPEGVQALVWVGMCEGITPQFLKRVKPFIGDRRVFGFALMDDPDPRPGLGGARPKACEADNLRAESDWLHANMPGTRTFIVLMNLGTGRRPFYDQTYNPKTTHIDLFGMCPYPCRSEWNGCDFGEIERFVIAAEAAGISRSGMVPIYQAVGGGQWRDDEGGKYVMPTPAQEEEIVHRWRALVPNPAFDMAYSWGSQKEDFALEDDPELQSFFGAYNRQGREP
jgi:hypothetical protein